MSSHPKGLKRSLPRPTVGIAIDADATSRETFPDEAHAVTKLVKDGMDKNAEASEAVIHLTSPRVNSSDGRYLALECGVDEDSVSRILNRLIERSVRRPFEKRSVVHRYHIDSLTYCVEHRQTTDDKKVRCWDERCCELDVRPSLSVAIAFQRLDRVHAHSFPSRSDVHHREAHERLTVDMSGNVFLQIDVPHGRGSGEQCRACVVVRRSDYKFPYRAVCRAVTCILSGREP